MTAGAPGLVAQRKVVARHTDDASTMRLALAAARRAGLAGEPPIGAALVREGQVIAVTANSIISSLDITAHAEINAIRDTCRSERTLDLAGCELYTTVEPCPMCLAASHYARIGRIVFGASLADLHAITGAEMLAQPALAKGSPTLSGGCLRSESLALLQAWFDRGTVRHDG